MSKPVDYIIETVRRARIDDAPVLLSTAQIRILEEANAAVGQLSPELYRYVPYGMEQPPLARVRTIGKRFIETWTPRLSRDGRLRTEGWEVRQSSMELHDEDCTCVGSVTLVDGIHPECGRRKVNLKAYWNEDEARPQTFGEHVRSLHIQAMSDEDYSGFYASIPGSDVAHADMRKLMHISHKASDRDKMSIWRGNDTFRSRADDAPRNARVGVRTVDKDGNSTSDRYATTRPLHHGKSQPLRGGTEITQGRRQWRDELKAKNLELHDNGYFAHKDRLRNEQKQKRERNTEEVWRKTEGRLKEVSEFRAIIEGDN